MPIQPSHITQIPQGPHSTARPVVAGTAIYCAHVFMSSGSGLSTGTASITFDLAVRSTFNIQAVWEFVGPGGLGTWWLDQETLTIPPPSDILPRPSNSIARGGVGYTTALTTAATRNGGSWTVTATGSDSLGDGGQVYLVIIVGANTEDDCVTYQVGG